MTTTTDHTGRTVVREGEGRHRAGHVWHVTCECGRPLGVVEVKRQAASLSCPDAPAEPAGLPTDAPREIPADEVEVGDEIHEPETTPLDDGSPDPDYWPADTWQVLTAKRTHTGDYAYECVDSSGTEVRWLYRAPGDLVSVTLNETSQAAIGHDLVEPMGTPLEFVTRLGCTVRVVPKRLAGPDAHDGRLQEGDALLTLSMEGSSAGTAYPIRHVSVVLGAEERAALRAALDTIDAR